MPQTIFSGDSAADSLIRTVKDYGRVLIVCDSAYDYLPIKDRIDKIEGVEFARFSSFTPNPLYEQVVEGVEFFNDEKCEAILVVGGGSAIDVAKCIKLFSNMDHSQNYLGQEARSDSNIPLIAVPTTAGTGSEATRFAVVYYKGEKQSIANDGIVPDYAVLIADNLKTLPAYQKKCALLDALCQAIESWWSVNSTEESVEYSKLSAGLIRDNFERYLQGDETANEKIMLASNYSGRAINITQTTAPHAMSYKLTSLYNIAHGHAVALCMPKVWRYMYMNIELSIHPKGPDFLSGVFESIALTLNCPSVEDAIEYFEDILKKHGMTGPENASSAELELLVSSVNTTRLKNNPVRLDDRVIKELYTEILSGT